MTVQFDADGTGRAEFRLGGLETGIHQGYVKIAGEDALAVDDTRWFTVDVQPARKVLLAAPEPAADYALFLSEAIAPHALRLKGTAAFQCETIPLPSLLKKPLAEYAAVCLLDPGPLAEDVWRQLAEYASAGGGVAVFLGAMRSLSIRSTNPRHSASCRASCCANRGPRRTWRPSIWSMRSWPGSARWKARSPGTCFRFTSTGCWVPWPMARTW